MENQQRESCIFLDLILETNLKFEIWGYKEPAGSKDLDSSYRIIQS